MIPPMISKFFSYAIVPILFVLLGEVVRRRFSKPSYPPGPTGLPLIGNVRDIPKSHEWVTYAKWTRKYGSDVIHLNLMGSHLIILNTAEAASDLLEKRSAIYSDRPRLPMLVELMGWDIMPFHRYDNKWRANRRLFNQYFNATAVPDFHSHIAKATHELLHRLAQFPAEFIHHNELWAASLMLNVAYGIDVQTSDNPFLVMIEAATKGIETAGNPGSFLVDTVPLLKYVPEWVPGAGFKKKAREWRKDVEATARVPFEHVKNNMGSNTPSMTSRSLDRLETDDFLEAQAVIRSTAAASFAAGSETSSGTLTTFFLAMVLYPDVVRKAQEELDKVVGHHRLPELSDLPYLPYISAITKEVYRWRPVLPLAFAHRAMKDDVYKGYFIPAGSLVLGNSWAILHDESVYKDPEIFNPDRFLKDGQLDPDAISIEAAFGFGRRICPGKHFANSSIPFTIASVLSTFDVGCAVGEDGKIIIPSGEYTSGTSSYPMPFICSIKPRSKQALELITETYSIYHPSS